MQIDAGAQGICTAKLGEAEVMAAGGINDILITTPIAGKNKIQRLVKLYQQYPDYRFIQVIESPATRHRYRSSGDRGWNLY